MEAESLTACPLYSVKKVWYLIFRSRRMFSRSLQIRAPLPERELGFYNKIVHEFLPYVLVYHSMFDRNLQTFNTVQAGNLTFIFYTLQKDKKEPVCEETDRQEEINDLSCRRR